MIFITGASRGIGQLLFQHFSDLGMECRGLYLSSSEARDPRLSRVDVRDYESVAAWIEAGVKEASAPEFVLINCAGVTYNAFGHKADVRAWRNVIDVNLIGSFHTAQAILPHMRAAGHGRIINFSSVVGQKGVPGTSAYAASKAGLWGLTKALAVENASKGVTINSINLGYFDIGIIEEVPDEQLALVVKAIPVARLGKPENIVKTVEFILANSDVCGSSLDVNGGLF
jgi:NAD(P)-dependent dehydrogenase (short-subunit alcohol dehydrogenase family)